MVPLAHTDDSPSASALLGAICADCTGRAVFAEDVGNLAWTRQARIDRLTEIDLRYSRMNQIDVSLQECRKGIIERADRLAASLGVAEKTEIGVEQLVGFGYWDVDPEPVSCGRQGFRRDVVLFEPRIDSCEAVGFGSDEALDLW